MRVTRCEQHERLGTELAELAGLVLPTLAGIQPMVARVQPQVEPVEVVGGRETGTSRFPDPHPQCRRSGGPRLRSAVVAGGRVLARLGRLLGACGCRGAVLARRGLTDPGGRGFASAPESGWGGVADRPTLTARVGDLDKRGVRCGMGCEDADLARLCLARSGAQTVAG
jgi:hypothetical protein